MRIAGMVAAGLLATAGVGYHQGQVWAANAPWGADVAEPVALLGSLHRAATHEMQLGELAQRSANTPDARQYGAELASDFRGIDQRILSLAGGLGIQESRLKVTQGGDVAVLRKDSNDYSRLATKRGEAFDRDFWVTVADAQAHESDLLATTANREPALTDLVTEMSRLYERSSRRALAAAQAAAAAPTEVPAEQLPSETPAAHPDQPATEHPAEPSAAHPAEPTAAHPSEPAAEHPAQPAAP